MAMITFEHAYSEAKHYLKAMRELYFDALVCDLKTHELQDIAERLFETQTSFERTTFLYNKRRRKENPLPLTIEEETE